LAAALAALLAVVAMLFAAQAPAQQSAAGGAIDLLVKEALRVDGGGERFPEGAQGQAQPLPDAWLRSLGHASGVTWYRLRFELPPGAATGPLLGAYFERACSHAQIHLNGERVHESGRNTSRQCYYPQLAPLPARLLRPGVNEIDVRLTGHVLEETAARQRAGGLSALRIGRYEVLEQQADWRRFARVTLAQITFVVLLLAGVGGLLVAYWQRLAYLGYLSTMALLWAVLTLRLWWRDPPLEHYLAELATASLFAPITAAAALFLMRYGGIRQRWIEICLGLQCLIVPLALWMAGPQRLFYAAMPWYSILAAEFAAVVIVFLMRAWRVSRTDFWLLGAGLVTIIGLISADVLMQHGVSQSLDGAHLIQVAMPVMLLVVVLRMFQVFALALRTAEGAHTALQSRVHDVTEQLARNYTALSEQRAEEAATQERKRIAADLHDDLGAKLLTIVHTSGDERIAGLARDALEEMRLSVRGIAGKPVQLADAAADWRSEAMSRLSQGGIELNWAAPGDNDIGERKLSARTYVQTTRILREAVSNMLKHSGASQCNVKVKIGESEFELVIADNGRGVPVQVDGMLDRGHGMSTMKRRAKQMQGQCLVESGPGYGTVIRLTLPL
jgi:signal transduction histidine kinase